MTRSNRRFAGWVLLAALSLVCCGCSQPATPEKKEAAAMATPAPAGKPVEPAAESQEDKTVLAVSQAIRKYHLSDREDQCLAYRFDPDSEKEAYTVHVMENHRHAGCGGDPNTAPRLFTVRVGKADGALSTDQGSAAGEFRPLR